MGTWSTIVDSLLSYNTVKIVRIRHRKLACLRWFFVICIVAYIVGWTILYQRRYLRMSAPNGSVRMQLMRGKNESVVTPEYCEDRNWTDGCVYWDDDFVLSPKGGESSFLASSRVTITDQEFVNQDTDEPCSDFTNPACKYDNVDTPMRYYVANIEDFTLFLDHAMYSDAGSGNAMDFTGQLLGPNGEPITNYPPPNVIGKKGERDIITLSLLLRAAGVDSLAKSIYDDEPLRSSGLVLIVFISYTNVAAWFDLSTITYTYEVKLVPKTEYKVVEVHYADTPYKRTTWNRHGIRVIFIQDGDLGVFDFQTLLLSFVSGLGLLAVATLIVDFIAFTLLPQKEQLARHKYRDLNEASLEPSLLSGGDGEVINTAHSSSSSLPGIY